MLRGKLRLFLLIAIEFSKAEIFIVHRDELGMTFLIEHGVWEKDFAARDVLLFDVLARLRHQLLYQYVKGHVVPALEILFLF